MNEGDSPPRCPKCASPKIWQHKRYSQISYGCHDSNTWGPWPTREFAWYGGEVDIEIVRAVVKLKKTATP